MGILSLVEILATFTQYIGIISSVKLSWPASLAWVPREASLLRADLTVLLPRLQLPEFNFRGQHVLLTNALPLGMALVLLILFKSIQVVVWYVCLLGGFGLLFVGLVLYFLQMGQLANLQSVAEILIIVGVAVVILLYISFLISWGRTKYKIKEASKDDKPQNVGSGSSKQILGSNYISLGNVLKELEKEGVTNRHITKSYFVRARNCITGIILLCIGIIATCDLYFLNQNFNYFSTLQGYLQIIGPIAGWILVGLGCALLYNWISGFLGFARRFNTRANYLFHKNAVKIVLVVLGILYVPITISVLTSFMCESVTSQTGFEFVQNQLALNFANIWGNFLQNSNTGLANIKCNYLSCTQTNQLCPEATELRLTSDKSISCSQEIFFYYTPGSILTLFSVTFGLPLLFYKLIAVSVAMIRKFPTKKNLTPNQKWALQCSSTTSSCSSLYTMFESHWRYYKLIILIQKLIVVMVFAVAPTATLPTLIVVFILNTFFATISSISQPYNRKFEDYLATACLFVNAINAMISILIAVNIEISYWISYFLISMNTVIPGMMIIVGFYFDWRQSKVEAKNENERSQRMKADAAAKIKKEFQQPTETRQSPTLKQPIKEESDSSESSDSSYETDSEEENSLPKIVEVKAATITPENQPLINATTPKLKSNTTPSEPVVPTKRPSLTPQKGDSTLQKGKPLTLGQIQRMQKEEFKRRREIARKKKQAALALIDTMDQELDIRLERILVNYFLILGVAAYLALLTTALGLLRTSLLVNTIDAVYTSDNFSDRDLIQSTNITISQLEFAGYNSWTQFTQNCCCNNSLQLDSNQNVLGSESMLLITEVWKCKSPPQLTMAGTTPFIYKQRLRKTNNINGFIMRKYCSNSFNQLTVISGPELDSDSGRVKVITTSQVPSFAALNLW